MAIFSALTIEQNSKQKIGAGSKNGHIKTDDTKKRKRSFRANMIVIMPKRKGKVVK